MNRVPSFCLIYYKIFPFDRGEVILMLARSIVAQFALNILILKHHKLLLRNRLIPSSKQIHLVFLY